LAEDEEDDVKFAVGEEVMGSAWRGWSAKSVSNGEAGDEEMWPPRAPPDLDL
jgi:hypothetical protein